MSNGQLRAFVERIEKLEEDKRQISAEMSYVYAEAKANGFDTKIIRKVVALRKKEAAKRDEEQALLDTYMAALGMIADLPLGRAALEREGLT
jgi:uncharacterized protein (UPF0335 family)